MRENAFHPVLSIPLVNYITWARAEIKRFQAERFVFAVQGKNNRYKIFQVFFGKDGSLYISFPYFDINEGLVTILTLPPILTESNISLEPGGKVTSQNVKYAHHPDGEVHFSQTGKVRTSIKKKSLPLANTEGHIFSLQFQGLSHFDTIPPHKDEQLPKLKRTVLTFRFNKTNPEALKIVGRWYEAKNLMNEAKGNTHGPVAFAQKPNGKITPVFLIGPPKGWLMDRYVLLVSCEETPLLDKKREPMLNFIAGFDPPYKANDLSQMTQFLCASYPVSNYDELLARIGSIDII